MFYKKYVKLTVNPVFVFSNLSKKMCKFCDNILGPGGFQHAESDCPLKQGCYCPVCGPGTHFPIHCPHKPKRASRFASAIQSDQIPPITQKTLVMADSNSGYVEYLKQHGLEIHRKQQDNADAVAKHLMSRDDPLVLVKHISTLALTDQDTVCGLSHGEVGPCLARKNLKTKK